jgi:hypothetical protein
MPQPKLRVLPDLRNDEYDRENYENEHYAIFGHMPPEEPGAKCEHPIHDKIRREMNGATIEVPFDGSIIISDDSPVAKEAKDRYDMIYNATKQFQKEIEQEDKENAARKAGLILPNRIY